MRAAKAWGRGKQGLDRRLACSAGWQARRLVNAREVRRVLSKDTACIRENESGYHGTVGNSAGALHWPRPTPHVSVPRHCDERRSDPKSLSCLCSEFAYVGCDLFSYSLSIWKTCLSRKIRSEHPPLHLQNCPDVACAHYAVCKCTHFFFLLKSPYLGENEMIFINNFSGVKIHGLSMQQVFHFALIVALRNNYILSHLIANNTQTRLPGLTRPSLANTV